MKHKIVSKLGRLRLTNIDDPKTYEFSALEFLARITPNIPNKWESTTRYYGVYSSWTRSVKKKRKSIDNSDSESATTIISSPAPWSQNQSEKLPNPGQPSSSAYSKSTR